MMDPMVRLEAIEAIRALKARYFRCLDCRLWDEMRSAFTVDMRVVTPSGEIYTNSGDEYVARLREGQKGAVSIHQGLTAEIDIIDERNAKAIWAMHDFIVWEDRHPRFGWKSISGYGHYHETYRIEDSAWRIATLSLTRLRLDEEWP